MHYSTAKEYQGNNIEEMYSKNFPLSMLLDVLAPHENALIELMQEDDFITTSKLTDSQHSH